MSRLLFVGEGELDAAAVPALVATLIEQPALLAPLFRKWRELRLNRHSSSGRLPGFEKKLRFARELAKDEGCTAVVATIDADNRETTQRIKDLRRSRDEDPRNPVLVPAALGEAVPHLEAWLVDDPSAIHDGLRLTERADIPSVTKLDSPKEHLRALMAESPRAGDPSAAVWADIARCVQSRRCTQRERTGYAAFEGEVLRFLRPLA